MHKVWGIWRILQYVVLVSPVNPVGNSKYCKITVLEVLTTSKVDNTACLAGEQSCYCLSWNMQLQPCLHTVDGVHKNCSGVKVPRPVVRPSH